MIYFMFCYQMQRGTTGLDVVNVLCDFFFTIRTVIGVICGYMHRRCSFNDWQALGVCSSYQRKSTKHYHTHCMIHREVLDAKHLGQFLPEVSLNSIKARPLQFRMFSKLCDERG